MAFIAFVSGTTLDATTMNDSFYHIGQDDILPLGGVNLDPTTGVANLGVTATAWNTIFCNNIEPDSSSSLWTLLTEFETSVGASSIEVSNINGDEDEYYFIIASGRGETSGGGGVLKLHFNTSSSPNYGFQTLQASGALTFSARDISESGFEIMNVLEGTIGTTGIGTNTSHSRLLINARTGKERTGILNLSEQASASETFSNSFASVRQKWIWNDKTTTITSFKFTGVGPGWKLRIWKGK